MPAGLVYRDMTTAEGVTVSVPLWADDTVTPTVFTPVSIRVGTDGVPIAAPLTDTQLRATAVPISIANDYTRELGRMKVVDDDGVVVEPIAPGTAGTPSADVVSVQPPGTPVRAIISAASSGNNTIVAAAGSGNIIVVHDVVLMAAGAVGVRFESGADGTALTGVMPVGETGGFTSGFNPMGHFVTAANTLLNLELSAGVQVSGWIVYTVRAA